MKIVYASRGGNTESLVGKCGYENALKIDTGSEEVKEDYVLFTYTDGYGDIPYEVDTFLAGNKDHIKAVVCTGNTSFGDAFCGAGDKVAEKCNVTLIAKVEEDGSDDDVAKIKEAIKALEGPSEDAAEAA